MKNLLQEILECTVKWRWIYGIGIDLKENILYKYRQASEMNDVCSGKIKAGLPAFEIFFMGFLV